MTNYPPVLIACGGLSGSGKSRVAREIGGLFNPAPGAVILRDDIVKKQINGCPIDQHFDKACDTPVVEKVVYDVLRQEAKNALLSGSTVIVDALFYNEKERKKIEAEEKKYQNEIERIREQIAIADEDTAEKLKIELAEVESNLSSVVVKKEEIVNLQNGKAGNIYIISNLGSFGENVFKIGMTRRLDPQDRVDELGSASVPFKFDVHSFIFSEDAVSLENELHKKLNNQRVNKVNMRKEFFYSTIDELETLTLEISPSAEFNRTMLAEEFRQSLSSEGNYTSDFKLEDTENDDADEQ